MSSGPGGLDPISQTWIYGEADNPDGTASGVLNLLANSVKTAINELLARWGPKTTFTPAWTNFNPGTTGATNQGVYWRNGPYVEGYVIATIGSAGSSFTGQPSFAAPVAPVGMTAYMPAGDVTFLDTGARVYKGKLLHNGAGRLNVFYEPVQTYYDAPAANLPFAFGSTDQILITFRYPAA